MQSVGCRQMDAYLHLPKTSEALKRRSTRAGRLTIVASDLNAEYLAMARNGHYTRGSVKELSAELQTRYFEKSRGGRRWSVRPELKTGIEWICQDFLNGPPPENKYDLILLRNNLLTYYRAPDVNSGFQNVMAALAPAGFLIIGAHEHLPDNATQLTPVIGSRLIYRHQA